MRSITHFIHGAAQSRDGGRSADVLDPSTGAVQAQVLLGDAALLEADGNEMAIGQLCHEVRLYKLGEDPFLPLLVSQSEVTEESTRLFSFAGVDALLDKPYSPTDVLKHLEDLAVRPRLFVVNGPYAGPEHRGKRRPDDASKHIEAFNGLRQLLYQGSAEAEDRDRTRSEWRQMLRRRVVPKRGKGTRKT